MDSASFFRALLPVLITSVVCGTVDAAVSPGGEITLMDQAWLGASIVVFPFWAGIRVARAGGLRRWSAVGGIATFVALLFTVVFSALIHDHPTDESLSSVLLGSLLFLPLLALFGFLGGLITRFRAQHGS